MAKDLQALLEALILFKTTTDNPVEIRKCARFIAGFLKKAGVAVEISETEGVCSVVATLRKTKNPKIFFNAHFDVIPAPDGLFRPQQRGGRLYGRGALDCKAQVAILLMLMKEFAALPREKQPDIGLMLTSDEEVGGERGVKRLLEEGYDCAFALVADAGQNFDIVTRHKGLLQLKLSAQGKSAHGSRPWLGENAALLLMEVYRKVQALFPTLGSLRSGKIDQWTATLNLGRIQAGLAVNQVPEQGEMLLDIRYTENETIRGLLAKVKGCCGKNVTVEILHSAPVLNTSRDNPYLLKLKNAAEHVLDRKVEFASEFGATDARYFAARQVPVGIMWSVGAGEHSSEEYVELGSVAQLYDILKAFIEACT